MKRQIRCGEERHEGPPQHHRDIPLPPFMINGIIYCHLQDYQQIKELVNRHG